jgi:hypothetical protein
MRRSLLFIALFLYAPPASAANVATWRHSSKADFDKGETTNLVVSRDGEVTLGRDIKELADLKCGSVWDLVRTSQGKMYAATALPGQVVEFTADGKLSPVWADDAVQAFSLAALADGSLLVGTGPQGIVYKISPEGKASEHYKTGGLYVWDLAVDSAGNTYAATGPKGEIHKIEPDGKGRLFYETNEQHVLCLALTADGHLLAGTDGAGLVLAIDSAGAGRVLYDAAESDVRALLVGPDGAVYAGTAAGASGMSMGSSASSGSGNQQSPTNSVYRLDASGGVRKVLSVKALVYSLGQAGQSPSQLVAGTGADGILYALDEDGRGERQLTRVDTELLLAMLPGRQGETFLATGNPGKLFVLSGQFEQSGTFESAPLDAKMAARFGALSWRAEVPEGTQVSLATRSGNTQKPDETWSPWSVEQTDPAKAKADCPPARFLQYRLTLRTNNPRATPVVRSVTARYQTANQQPQITKITVPHVDEGDGKKVLEKLKLTWNASDPNSDDLTYRLTYRKQDWKAWVTLKSDLTAAEYEWDVTSVPEGIYCVQVEASDRRSNPPEEAMVAVMTSEPMAVDRNGPRVEAKLTASQQQSATFEVQAADTISPLVSAAYSLDSDNWVNLFPADGLFDSTSERFRFDLSKLAPGTHVLVVRVTDASGQTSSDDVVFEVK